MRILDSALNLIVCEPPLNLIYLISGHVKEYLRSHLVCSIFNQSVRGVQTTLYHRKLNYDLLSKNYFVHTFRNCPRPMKLFVSLKSMSC
jgi:hypothetical protein